MADELLHARAGWIYLACQPAPLRTAIEANLPSLVKPVVGGWWEDGPIERIEGAPEHGILSLVATRRCATALRDIVIPAFERLGLRVEPTWTWLTEREATLGAPSFAQGGAWRRAVGTRGPFDLRLQGLAFAQRPAKWPTCQRELGRVWMRAVWPTMSFMGLNGCVYPLVFLLALETHCGSGPQATTGGGRGSPASPGASSTGSPQSSSSPSPVSDGSSSSSSSWRSGLSSGSSAFSGLNGSNGPGKTDASPGDASAESDAAGITPGVDGGGAGNARLADARAPFEASPGGPVYAFPEAVGFGRTATGGRGGAVVHVTNLSDSGTGSLRDAVSAGNRIVVFDVGGAITISTPISVSSGVTIAGQTAPGDGIAIQGDELSFSAHMNAIVRYVRVRPGCSTCTRTDPDFERSGINLASSSTMIFDHVSVEFAQWNNIDSVGATNITVQRSIIADPVGQQFAAHTETGPYTWYGNVFANAHNRNPLAKANTQYVNNVIYNYQLGYTAGNTAGTFSHDVIANMFIAGPSTTTPSDAFFQVNNQPMFLSGNLLDGNANGTLDAAAIGLPAGAVSLAAAWSPATMPLPASVDAATAYAAAIADAGASLQRDQVDALVIADVTSLGAKGQLWTTPTATGLSNGGFGTLVGGTPPLDTDGDGMPDAWELRYGLNPNNPADATGDFDDTGYTNVEKYINSIVDGQYP